jgi:hypothetical protein
MSRLPVIPKKQFEVKSKYLPKGKVSLIPFTVGLEDLLIQVKESEDIEEKKQAIIQVIEACIQNKDLDVGSIPNFVIEEIFIRLRQNSVGEIIDQLYKCTNENEDEQECGNTMPLQIDLRELKIVEPEGHTNTIIVADPIGIKFKYPTIETPSGDDVETILSCIESIFDDENVYPAEDHTPEELREFWSQLTFPQKKEVFEKFFATIPHIHYQKTLTCSKCKHEHAIEFNSVQEVFQ